MEESLESYTSLSDFLHQIPGTEEDKKAKINIRDANIYGLAAAFKTFWCLVMAIPEN